MHKKERDNKQLCNWRWKHHQWNTQIRATTGMKNWTTNNKKGARDSKITQQQTYEEKKLNTNSKDFLFKWQVLRFSSGQLKRLHRYPGAALGDQDAKLHFMTLQRIWGKQNKNLHSYFGQKKTETSFSKPGPTRLLSVFLPDLREGFPGFFETSIYLKYRKNWKQSNTWSMIL